MIENKIQLTTETDIMKSIAVFAAMWQSILTLMMKQPIGVNQSVEAIILYDFVKFSAPVFIFAILFDISKIKNGVYTQHIFHKAKELLVPYFCWTTVYILTINTATYKNFGDCVQAYLFGTSAGHLWYLVMMFQFQLLVPVSWVLFRKLSANKKKIAPVLVGAIVFYSLFLFVYNKYIFDVTKNKYLLYIDRSFIAFSIYAILGIVASVTYEKWKRFISKVKYVAIPLFFIVFTVANNEMFKDGFKKLTLAKSIYLKPSMFLYNILAITLIFAFALMLIKNNSRLLPKFKFISTYAIRAYFANVFCLNIIVKVMGKTFQYMPFNLTLILLFIMTAVFSFTLVYTLAFIWRKLKMRKEKEVVLVA